MSHYAGTITSASVRADSATMLKVSQGAQGNVNDVVTGGTTQGGHHCEAARVFLFGRVVEPDRSGRETKPLMRQWKRHETLRKYSDNVRGTTVAQESKSCSAELMIRGNQPTDNRYFFFRLVAGGSVVEFDATAASLPVVSVSAEESSAFAAWRSAGERPGRYTDGSRPG